MRDKLVLVAAILVCVIVGVGVSAGTDFLMGLTHPLTNYWFSAVGGLCGGTIGWWIYSLFESKQ